MIEKVVKKYTLGVDDHQQELDDLEYWLSRPPEERVDEVERLRKIYCGTIPRLERVAVVVKPTSG